MYHAGTKHWQAWPGLAGLTNNSHHVGSHRRRPTLFQVQQLRRLPKATLSSAEQSKIFHSQKLIGEKQLQMLSCHFLHSLSKMVEKKTDVRMKLIQTYFRNGITNNKFTNDVPILKRRAAGLLIIV